MALFFPQPIRLLSQGGSTRTCPANTSENILQTITIPAGAMGANGWLRIETGWATNNDASVKTARVRLGGIGGTIFHEIALTSTSAGRLATNISNKALVNSQQGGSPTTNSVAYGIYGSAAVTGAVDTSAAVDLVLTGQMADSTDTLSLVFHSVVLFYAG